jgi:hypothetical protein
MYLRSENLEPKVFKQILEKSKQMFRLCLRIKGLDEY